MKIWCLNFTQPGYIVGCDVRCIWLQFVSLSILAIWLDTCQKFREPSTTSTDRQPVGIKKFDFLKLSYIMSDDLSLGIFPLPTIAGVYVARNDPEIHDYDNDYTCGPNISYCKLSRGLMTFVLVYAHFPYSWTEWTTKIYFRTRRYIVTSGQCVAYKLKYIITADGVYQKLQSTSIPPAGWQ